MYSKKESVPRGASRPQRTDKMRSTSATEKLFSGSPETTTLYFSWPGRSSTGQWRTRARGATA